MKSVLVSREGRPRVSPELTLTYIIKLFFGGCAIGLCRASFAKVAAALWRGSPCRMYQRSGSVRRDSVFPSYLENSSLMKFFL